MLSLFCFSHIYGEFAESKFWEHPTLTRRSDEPWWARRRQNRTIESVCSFLFFSEPNLKHHNLSLTISDSGGGFQLINFLKDRLLVPKHAYKSLQSVSANHDERLQPIIADLMEW